MTKESCRTSAELSPHGAQSTTSDNVDIKLSISSTYINRPTFKTQQSALSTKPHLNIFSQNVDNPTILIDLPEYGARINTTPQLALCIGLLSKIDDAANQQEDQSQVLSCENAPQIAWLKSMKQDSVEQERLRRIGNCMVEEFAKDASKDSTKIAEMVLLGPLLDKEHYRRLLSCTITAFDHSVLLDVDMLQGLVQLIQSAPSEALLPDDLVKILRVLRVRLQETHGQSSEHSYHLTSALARVLDVMAEHKVRDLDRVEEHEPLSGVLSGLEGNSDPYLMYQACYAFQALQYVPNNESPLQAVLRHSTGVADGLIKVTAVFKLDLSAVLEGLDNLQEAIGSVAEVAGTVYKGVNSLMESGRGIFASMKEVCGSGQKQPWYAAIHAAYAFVQTGQLRDLNILIYEAPCRRDPLFQWGICRLLGDIASDEIWDITARLQAVDLLGDLYKNDADWVRDESVNTWMLSIIRQLCASTHQTVSTKAEALLKDLNWDQGTNTANSPPYPLRNRLSLPSTSPLLTRVLDIPDVEYSLHQLKMQRLDEHRRGVYIPPQAKPNLQAPDNTVFPLMERVQKFLSGEQQVFLVLGDSGAGKSTFNLELERTLWKNYKKYGPIPLHVSLPTIDNPAQDLIEKQLQYHNFSREQILEMKLRREFILICDGYDESQLKVNIYNTNQFNQSMQWKVKLVISCRTQYLGQDYRSRFQPQPVPVHRYQRTMMDDFQEAVVAAFSKSQIQQYVDEYVKNLPNIDPIQNKPSWTAEEYMDKLTKIPNLMDLVSNPFLLTLALDALPSIFASKKDLSAIRITRVQLYDSFVKRWLEVNRMRLEASPLSSEERSELDMLIEDNFLYHGIHYQKDLATAIFIDHAGNPVVNYTHLRDKNTWKAAFFSPNGQVKLLRESSTVKRSGAFFRFLHRTLLEYFYSRTIYDPLDYDTHADESDEQEPICEPMACLARMNIVKEPSILQFLAERVPQDPSFQQQLLDAIEQSKTDAKVAQAAANAISILVKAGVSFNGADLRGVKIPGADLSDGQFDSTQFQGGDLMGVNLSKSWLRQADLSHAQLEGVQFGELPYLKVGGSARNCTYSPDGRMLGVALCSYGRGISIYDTHTWQRLHVITATERVRSVAFSPDSQRIVSGGYDKMVRLWSCTSGKELLIMKGHTHSVMSVTFSLCGRQIASSSADKTVRLWDAQSGESLFVLQGHTAWVTSVKFSTEGRQFVSGSEDGTIRFWNSETGEAGVVLSPSLGGIYSLALSPDGRWIASGHEDGDLRLWDVVSGVPGPVLEGHTGDVTGIVFSPNSQLIASSSDDYKVILWDVATGNVVSTFDGHSDNVCDVTFSSDGRTIVSGSEDTTVRLWVLNSSRSNIDTQGQINDALTLAYTPNGRSILSVNRHRIIRQGDASTGACGPALFEFPKALLINTMAFSADGNQIVTGCRDGSVRLWDCRTGTAGQVLEGHSSKVEALAYSACGRWIASADNNTTVRLWDRYDTEQRYVLVDAGGGFGNGILGLTFSPSGNQLAVCSRNGNVWLVDPRTRALLLCKKLREEWILTMDYSPNGQKLALGTKTSIVTWSLQSDEPGLELMVPGSSRQRSISYEIVAYSSCGEFLASSNSDFILHLWKRQLAEGGDESWSCASALRVFLGPVAGLCWNPVVPREFITASQDGSVRVWRVSDEDGSISVKMLWGTNLRRLCGAGVVLGGATSLSPIHQNLLAQCNAFDKSSSDDD